MRIPNLAIRAGLMFKALFRHSILVARRTDRLVHRLARARPGQARPVHIVPPDRDAGGAAAEAARRGVEASGDASDDVSNEAIPMHLLVDWTISL